MRRTLNRHSANASLPIGARLEIIPNQAWGALNLVAQRTFVQGIAVTGLRA